MPMKELGSYFVPYESDQSVSVDEASPRRFACEVALCGVDVSETRKERSCYRDEGENGSPGT